MSILTSLAVDAMMANCLSTETDAWDDDVVEVKGIISRFRFSAHRIAEHSEDIGKLLAELPDEFHASKGGGWTFLNACMDRHGTQWTGLHQQQERLFALGIAAGKARWLMPRVMWDILPGGVPYVSVN